MTSMDQNAIFASGNTNLDDGYHQSSANGSFFINPHNMPWWQEGLWFTLFGTIVLVSSGGNSIVIWIVLTEKRMRTVTNIFLVNLSIADLMVATLNVFFSVVYLVTGHWPFGIIYCKFSQFLALLSITASVFTLMAISSDRYLAIMYPLRRRLGRKSTLCIVMLIWSIACVVALPYLLFYTVHPVPTGGGGHRIMCYAEWPDGDQSNSHMEYIHSILVLVLTYVIPMIVMGVTYTRIGVMLWGSKHIGERTFNNLDLIKSKRKVVKMMIVVVTIFGICWLPFHLYFVLYKQFPNINNHKYIQEIYLTLYWFAMSNSMYNPMIYCWLNSRFRNGFRRVLSHCCVCIKPNSEDSELNRSKTFSQHSRGHFPSTRAGNNVT